LPSCSSGATDSILFENLALHHSAHEINNYSFFKTHIRNKMAEKMAEKGQLSSRPPKDEIRLIDILDFLVSNKFLIFSIISIFTLSSIIYSFSVTPVYKTTISFLPSHEHHTSEPHIKEILNNIRQSLFKKFIDQLKSADLQKRVADNGNFLSRFLLKPGDTPNPDGQLAKIHRSITISKSKWNNDLNLIQPTWLEMTGSKPKVISDFSNALIEAAIKNIQEETLKIVKDNIDALLDGKHPIDELQDKKNYNELIEKKRLYNLKLLNEMLMFHRRNAMKERLNKIKRLDEKILAIERLNIKGESAQFLDPYSDFGFLNGKQVLLELRSLLNKRDSDDWPNSEISKIKTLIDLHKEATDNDILWSTRPVVNLLNGLGLKSIYKEVKDIKLKAKKLKAKNFKAKKLKAKNLKAIKENLKTPEVIRISQKSVPPIHPIEPDKFKLITLGLSSGIFVALFTAILLSGLRALKREKSHNLD
jgi:LPS O-antigen subunit length determinant protein (WzzB/FepE family)